ncbi:hypothetical protein [Streptomyces avermitilis]|uniref:hypothetical protein n=1 Tax=Streptomyces avermitilis TaxID=33903 RepID=UPI003721D0EA
MAGPPPTSACFPRASGRCCRRTRSTSPLHRRTPPQPSPPGRPNSKSCSTRGKQPERRRTRYSPSTKVRHYAAALSTTTSALGDKLTERAAAATERAAAAESRFGEHAAALADVDGFDASADLTAPQSLHHLVAAAGQATKEAEDQRGKQRDAQDLIKPAADLGFAITAGEARYEALEVLRGR